MNLQALIEKSFPDKTHVYTQRDTMLYALGVGACNDPLDPESLKLVYERKLQAIPSIACVLAHPGFWVGDPVLGINVVKLVHAEQHFALHSPLPSEGEVFGRFRITGAVDKGPDKGVLVYFEKALCATDGTLLGTVGSTYFMRGDGGCGSWGEAAPELPAVPSAAASGMIELPTLPIAGLIYRLSGDYNPLHADPEIARKAGFDRPILHGLCTYGVACVSLARALCADDVGRLRSMSARFTKPVFPGESIRTEYWLGNEGTLQFRCSSIERGEVVLDRGTASIAA